MNRPYAARIVPNTTLVVALVVALAGAGLAAPTTPKEAPVPTLSAPLEALRALFPTLLDPATPARTFADALGAVTEEQTRVFKVKPTSPLWTEAYVGRAMDGPGVDYVELTLAEDTVIHLRELTAWLGEGRFVPLLHPGRPERVAFYLDRPEYGRVAAIFAGVEGTPRPDARVVHFLVRADGR